MANKKRLIDANVWKKETCEWCNEHYPDEPCEPSDCAAMQYIDNFPTADAVEVVHGRWEDKWEKMWNLERPVVIGWECSVCGFLGCEEFNYCPNCGADMRERKDNERKAD